jgi:hypothetical protein
VALGCAVIVIGLGGLVFANTRDNRRLRRELRRTSGQGWLIGWLMSKPPGSGASIAFSLMSLGIVGLGIASLVSN